MNATEIYNNDNTVTNTSASNSTHPGNENDHEVNEDDHRFACNICLENVSTPVVTRCGHLYCWPCLYVWLEPGMDLAERQYLSGNGNGNVNPNIFLQQQAQTPIDATRRMCPVCKSACSVKEVVPIYVREERRSNCGHDQQKQQKFEGGEVSEKDIITIADDDSVDDGGTEESLSSADGDGDGDVDMNVSAHENNDITAGTGLRRRRRRSITTHEHEHQPLVEAQTPSANVMMPSRPPPPPSTIQHVTSQPPSVAATTAAHTVPVNAIPNHQGRNSALAIHQSLFQALVGAHAQSHSRSHSMLNSQHAQRSAIPSLHDRSRNAGLNISGMGDGISDQQTFEEGTMRDAASEFLSRLLLMLGCFVVLCLLLF